MESVIIFKIDTQDKQNYLRNVKETEYPYQDMYDRNYLAKLKYDLFIVNLYISSYKKLLCIYQKSN